MCFHCWNKSSPKQRRKTLVQLIKNVYFLLCSKEIKQGYWLFMWVKYIFLYLLRICYLQLKLKKVNKPFSDHNITVSINFSDIHISLMFDVNEHIFLFSAHSFSFWLTLYLRLLWMITVLQHLTKIKNSQEFFFRRSLNNDAHGFQIFGPFWTHISDCK